MKNFSDGLIDNDEIITCKKHTQFKTRVKNIPYFLPKWLKNIPFGGTQNYIAHKRKSSPPPRIYAIMISCKNHSLFYYFTNNRIANGLYINTLQLVPSCETIPFNNNFDYKGST